MASPSYYIRYRSNHRCRNILMSEEISDIDDIDTGFQHICFWENSRKAALKASWSRPLKIPDKPEALCSCLFSEHNWSRIFWNTVQRTWYFCPWSRYWPSRHSVLPALLPVSYTHLDVYKRQVARLSFPYPSRRFTTPHTPRPAPIATTRVFKVVIALLKNAIYS